MRISDKLWTKVLVQLWKDKKRFQEHGMETEELEKMIETAEKTAGVV